MVFTVICCLLFFFFFKQKTAYEMRISDWSSECALPICVVRAGTDDLAVLALLDHVRAPARGAGDHEQRREHRGGHTHHVVRAGREPVEVGEHLLDLAHRSEERRVGNKSVSTCRPRRSPYNSTKKKRSL